MHDSTTLPSSFPSATLPLLPKGRTRIVWEYLLKIFSFPLISVKSVIETPLFLRILLFTLQRFKQATAFPLQGSASESTLVGLLAAKQRTVRRVQVLHPEWDEATIKGKLVAYSSGSSHNWKYSRVNSTKSPASGAGNVSEPRLTS
jgi:hypothetical protein